MSVFWRGLIVAILTALTVLACIFSPTADLGDSSGVVMKLPLYILDYDGEEYEWEDRERELLPKDTGIERVRYISHEGDRQITCSIVLAGDDSRSIHRPEICLPSQGWRIKGRFVRDFEVKGETQSATVLLVERDVQLKSGETTKLLSYNVYWFVGKDLTTHSHIERVWKTSWDNVFRNVNHRWAYVTVNSMIPSSVDPNGAGEEETMKVIEEFISDVVPRFQKSFMD